jgi:primosomal protein N' (replication factor Y) (superfamily II helicase)
VNLRVDGRDARAVEDAAADLARALRTQAASLSLPPDAVMGPAPPPIERIKGRHRWQVLLRAAAVPPLRALARAARAREGALRRIGVRLVIDVDPYSM